MIEETTSEEVDIEVGSPVRELRRSARVPKLNPKYSSLQPRGHLNYLLLSDGGEPESYDEALRVDDASKWELAMKDEIKSLNTNKTWELAKLPTGKKALSNKWVYRIKEEHGGSKRYKAKFVVKGFQQRE